MNSHRKPGQPESPSPQEVAQETTELSVALTGWMSEARQLVEQVGAASLAAELDLLAEQRGRSEFRAAVVGEFNRGKSTLVNRLVGATLLPVGPVPTTRGFVVVAHAEQAALTVQWPDGRVESRIPGPEMWDGLTVDETVAEPTPEAVGAGPSVKLRLGLPCIWLRTLKAEIIDTPGTNEAQEDRAAEVRQSVTLSDGVLLVVSAGSPLSRTERHLLEQEVLRRRVAFLAVVVTFLDQLEPEERAVTLAAVRARIDRIAPGTPVLPAPGPDGGDEQLATVKNQLERFAAHNADRRWRSRKLASAVAEICIAVADLGALAAETASLAEEQRRAAATQEREALARDTAIWNQLRVELDSRRRALVHRIRDSLAADTASLVEGLRDELLQAVDPSTFWERDVRHQLRQRLLALTEKTESAVVEGLTEDVTWLDHALADRFAVTEPSQQPTPMLVPPQPRPQEQVKDAGLVRVLTLLGAPLGKILGELLSGLARLPNTRAAAVKTAGVHLGELVVEKTVQVVTARQRVVVDQQLESLVQDTLDRFTVDVSQRLQDLYTEVVDGLAQRRASWRSARSAALSSNAAHLSTVAAPTATVARATELANQIRLALDSDTTTLTESR